jgi:uncharacterized membrane protein
MAFTAARLSAQLLATAILGGGIRTALARQPMQLTPPPGIHGEGEPEPISPPAALARTAIPPAALSGLLAFGILALRAARPTLALKVARFTNLSLASLLTGNGVGSLLFVHPALGSLAEDEYVRSEQALSRHYPDVMRTLMPAAVVSGLTVLWLNRDRGFASFWLTLAGTAGFAGALGLTGLEIPLNKRSLTAAPAAPPTDWSSLRADWNRFNQLRVLCEVVGWSCLCLSALSDTRLQR